jgi:hypothetical protein
MLEFDPSEWLRHIELRGFTRAWTTLGFNDRDLINVQAAMESCRILPRPSAEASQGSSR